MQTIFFFINIKTFNKKLLYITKKKKKKKKNCEFQKKIALYQQKIPTNKKKMS